MSRQRAVYDDIAPRYDSAIRPLERWFLSKLRRQAFENVPKTGRLLEIGTGTGSNFIFYPGGVAGAATEPSSEMLRLAGLKTRPASIRLVQSCGEHLPFGNHSFDAAVATLVMCSVESPQEVFAELRRVIKPGGTVVLLDHVRPGGLLGPIFDFLNLMTTALFGDHLNRRTAAMAQAAGFTILKREKRLIGIINLIVCRV